jgi:RHS repeat-associated protein
MVRLSITPVQSASSDHCGICDATALVPFNVQAAGYGVGGTGNLTSLKTFQSSTLDGTGAATTGWNYDQATGPLANKIWADGSQDVYTYNTAGQLKGLVMPGITNSSFVYNNAGELTSSSLTDATTGTVSTSINMLDDLGRALSTTSADNGSSNTTTNSFTALGDPNAETFSSAGNTSVGHSYYPAANAPTTGAPDALATLKITPPNAQTPVTQTYAYDPNSKRLQTITINGVNITIVYLSMSDQIQSITAGKVTTTLTPDASDAARLGAINVTNNSTLQSLYSATFTNSELDQRTSDTISRVNVANDGTTSNESAGYTYIYDPNHADALISVKDSHGNVLYSYTPDGVGNLTGTVLGTVNTLNQYSADQYNSRGDVTDNGTYTLSWDANDRPISIAPKSVAVGSLQVKLGYDSQDRWLWKDVYQWNGNAWAYSYSRHAVWDGNNLVAELDQNNLLVKGYTWGPTGLLAITDYSNPASPKSYLTIADASGNIVMLADPVSGTVVASYHYDPYGNLLSATGPQAGLSSFLGKGLFVHSELPGLMWAGHRVTDGKIWLSRDPSGESGGLNVYGLYLNDPINNVDPSGLAPAVRYIPLWRVYGEALAEVAAKYPGKSSGDIVETHWFSADQTFSDIVNQVYEAKRDWYSTKANTVVNDTGTAPAPGQQLNGVTPAEATFQQNHAEYYKQKQSGLGTDPIQYAAWEREVAQHQQQITDQQNGHGLFGQIGLNTVRFFDQTKAGQGNFYDGAMALAPIAIAKEGSVANSAQSMGRSVEGGGAAAGDAPQWLKNVQAGNGFNAA